MGHEKRKWDTGKNMGGINTRVYESISEVDPDEWNSVVGCDRLIARHEYLLAVEKSNINDCKYFYPVIYDGNGIMAHACAPSLVQLSYSALNRVRHARCPWQYHQL